MNSEPLPSSLLTWIVPPIASTRFLTIGSPSPLPRCSLLRAECSRANGSNRCSRNSSLMPMPLSRTTNLMWSLSFSASILVTVNQTSPPSGVNFAAFDRRLKNIWLNLSLSTRIVYSPGWSSSWKLM